MNPFTLEAEFNSIHHGGYNLNSHQQENGLPGLQRTIGELLGSFFPTYLRPDRLFPSTLQLLDLFPQHIRPECAVGSFNPLLSIGILGDGAPGGPRAGEKTRLAAQEQASDAEEHVGDCITERCGLKQGSYIGNGLFAAVGKADVRGLVGSAEGPVEGGAVRAQTDGE